MKLKFYNTLTGMIEEFKPLHAPRVSMYHCGPTVYSFAHIGNFRTFLYGDIMRRLLEYLGYDVTQVMNITDVGHLTEDDVDSGEDKMEKAARKEKRSVMDIAGFYTEGFFEDLDLLGMKRAHYYPKASEYIDDMIKEVQLLEERGYAYRGGDVVLFDISKFPSYGKLSGKDLNSLRARAGSRLTEEEIKDKRNAGDFRLWKIDPEHLMKWDSPWGTGYPGWHIECSTMARKLLGDTIDIHTGGEDNIFPHHESEIAQAEGASGKQFCRYWLHVKHLMLEGKKISKSLGNVYRVKDLAEKGYNPRAVRLALVSGSYRQQVNFTFDGIRAAEENIEKINNFIRRCEKLSGEGGEQEIEEKSQGFLDDFHGALCNDLNVPVAMSHLMAFVRDINRMEPGRAAAQTAVQAVKKADEVLGLLSEQKTEVKVDEAQIEKLIEDRKEARESKNWELADRIRDDLNSMGILIEDGPEGTTWRVK